MTGACRRIVESENSHLQKWVPDLLAGKRWASLGTVNKWMEMYENYKEMDNMKVKLDPYNLINSHSF